MTKKSNETQKSRWVVLCMGTAGDPGFHLGVECVFDHKEDAIRYIDLYEEPTYRYAVVEAPIKVMSLSQYRAKMARRRAEGGGAPRRPADGAAK